MLMACHVTKRSLALVGIAKLWLVLVVIGNGRLTDDGAGATGVEVIPGVLLRVFRQCNRGVSFNLLFTVGLRASMIPGASVISGSVIMG